MRLSALLCRVAFVAVANGSKVPMGPDDIPSSGINLGGQTYLVVNTGADTSLAVPHQNAYSVLVRFDETAKTFTAGRTISSTPAGGHFVFTAMVELPPQFVLPQLGPGVAMFGEGSFRTSDLFLAYVPTGTFWSGAGTVYYTGLKSGLPVWSSSESAAVPIVVDEPLAGQPGRTTARRSATFRWRTRAISISG